MDSSSDENNIIFEGKEVIRILKWKIRVGSRIGQMSHLIFNYKTCNEDLEPIGEELRFKCKKVGIIVEKLMKKEGDIVVPNEVVLAFKMCSHNTIMKDLCADCGANINSLDPNDRQRISELTNVSMVHSVPELRVSKERAETLGRADEQRLLKDRKLVLLVDLDQTIIHSTNHPVPSHMTDVYHFQLYGPQTQWYHTKFRPHTIDFLKSISKLFELHICTFGARRYAHEIANLIDPKGIYFPKDRILSRDECFDPTSKTGNMKSLFPCGDSMVCIIDDREDVWNYASNLVAVKPYICFRDTGDINAPEKPVSPLFVNDMIENNDKTLPLKQDIGEVDRSSVEEKAEMSLIVDKLTETQTNDSKSGETIERFEKIDESTDEKISGSQEMEEIKTKDASIESVSKPVESISEVCNTYNEKNSVESEQRETSVEVMATETNIQEKAKETNCVQNELNVEVIDEIVGEKAELIEEKVEEKAEVIDEKVEEKAEVIDEKVEEKAEVIDEKVEEKAEVIDEKVEEKAEVIDEKVEEKAEVIEEKIEEKAEVIDEKVEERAEVIDENKTKESEIQKNINEDNDDYLLYLEEILTRIHSEYYKEYDEKIKYNSESEEIKIPDLKDIIPRVRKSVLRGVNIVFSGVIPTNTPPEKNKLYNIVKHFGSTVTPEVVTEGSPKTTHLIAAKWGTVKVNKCIKMRNIWIVNPNWVYSCAERWERVDERLYPLDKEEYSVEKDKHLQKPIPESNIKNQFVNQSNTKPAIANVCPVYDPITGKRIRSDTQTSQNPFLGVKSDPGMKGTEKEAKKVLERSRQIQPHNMLEFSPLSGFTRNELQSMGKEVDDACSEGDEMSTGNTDSESDIDVEEIDEKKVVQKRECDSSSDESIDADCPKGWNNSKKFKRSRNNFDLEDSTIDSSDFDKIRRINDEDSTEGSSIGSVDEEMALAVEREFLS